MPLWSYPLDVLFFLKIHFLSFLPLLPLITLNHLIEKFWSSPLSLSFYNLLLPLVLACFLC